MDNKPVCPHCDHVEQDAWEINFGGCDGSTEVTCNSCGEDYFLERIVYYNYKSAKLKEKNGGQYRNVATTESTKPSQENT